MPELAGIHSCRLLEDAAEIGLVLEAGTAGDLAHRQGGLAQQLLGDVDAEPGQIVPWGKTKVLAENPGQLILADVDRLGKLPAADRLGGMIIQEDDPSLDQHPGQWGEHLRPADDFLQTMQEIVALGDTGVGD